MQSGQPGIVLNAIFIIGLDDLFARRSMEFRIEENSSSFVGAIFMSNRATKDECFQRKVFALPPSMTSFVKQIKKGMILFLFEYEERKLYGVFEASSDGDVNIVLHAFNNPSGKSFPAQVKFNIIWSCRPLSEPEFREAIKDNYYQPYKFHFYLSDEQVYKLLLLFNEKKTKNGRSVSLGAGNRFAKPIRNCGSSGMQVTITNDRIVNELGLDPDEVPVNLRGCRDSYRPNLSLSGHHREPIQNKESSVTEHRSFSATPHPSEPLMLDLEPSTSHTEGFIGGHHNVSSLHNFCHYPRSSSFLPGHLPCSSEPDYRNSIPKNELDYSKSPTENPLLFSRMQPYMAHMELATQGLSSNVDHPSLDVGTDVKHYRTLPSPDHFESFADNTQSMKRYFEKRYANYAAFEGYDGLSSYHYNPSIVPRLDRSYEPSTATVPLPEAENFGLRIADLPFYSGSLRKGLSQYENDHIGNVSQWHPVPHEEYHPAIAKSRLLSDSLKKKASVFSRLSVQDDKRCEPSADASVNEIMGLLSQRREGWRAKPRLCNVWLNNKPVKKKAHVENEMSGVDAVDDDENMGNSEDTDQPAEEICESPPILNFRRRSEVLRMREGETEKRDHAEGGKQKRRKLVRPSIGKEDSFHGGTSKCLSVEGTLTREIGDRNVEIRKEPVTRNTESGFPTFFSEVDSESLVCGSGVKEDNNVENSSGLRKKVSNVELLFLDLNNCLKSAKSGEGNEQGMPLELNFNQTSAEDVRNVDGLLTEDIIRGNANLKVGIREDGASGDNALVPSSEQIKNEDTILAINDNDKASNVDVKGNRKTKDSGQNVDLPVYNDEAQGKMLGETRKDEASLVNSGDSKETQSEDYIPLEL